MRLYTFVTQSHRQMLEEFLRPSATEFEVNVQLAKQHGSPDWNTSGFNAVMRDRTCYYYDMVAANAGETIVLADTDIVFCKPALNRIVSLLGEADLAGAPGKRNTLCAGFLVVRCTPNSLRLFQTIRDDPDGVFSRHSTSDQAALNHYRGMAEWRRLPSVEFWSVGEAMKRCWTGPSDELRGVLLPQSAVVFHANFCVGIERKHWLLRRVQELLLEPGPRYFVAPGTSMGRPRQP